MSTAAPPMAIGIPTLATRTGRRLRATRVRPGQAPRPARRTPRRRALSRCGAGEDRPAGLGSGGPGLPLSIGQAPPAPQRSVEADVGQQPVAADLRQRVLRRVELLLRLEHLEVAREAEAVSIRGVLDGLLQRLHGAVLPRLGLAQLAQGGER